MKQKDFHIYLTEQERTQVISALIQLKNSLIAQGRYANFHFLRHTFATRCVEIGFDVKTLSEIHRIDFTLILQTHDNKFDVRTI